MSVDLNGISRVDSPFTHFIKKESLPTNISNEILYWLKNQVLWKEQSIDRFYESYNINVRNILLPEKISFLKDDALVNILRIKIESLFKTRLSSKVDISAHKLIEGQKIRVHTDFSSIGQSHRILIQFNDGWEIKNGGLLMFFDNEDPLELGKNDKIYLPIHGSLIAFEISERSFHAVSEVKFGERYTFVYSFYRL